MNAKENMSYCGEITRMTVTKLGNYHFKTPQLHEYFLGIN